MPRKFFKRISPDPKKIKENRFLRIFGDWLHEPQLWHLNRYSASMAIGIGLFCAFIPVPFQMVIAAGLAIFLRANLPVSIATCWVTNPLTIPPMFYFAYKVGAWILGTPESPFEFELSMEWLQNELILIWKPFLLGCLICAIVAGLLGYFAIQMAWRYHVVMAWRARKERWKAKIKEKLHIGESSQNASFTIEQLQNKLDISLPTSYLDILKNYPKLLLEKGNTASKVEFIQSPQQLLDLNEFTRTNLDLGASHFAIGESGCGDYYFIDIDEKDPSVHFWNHDISDFDESEESSSVLEHAGKFV